MYVCINKVSPFLFSFVISTWLPAGSSLMVSTLRSLLIHSFSNIASISSPENHGNKYRIRACVMMHACRVRLSLTYLSTSSFFCFSFLVVESSKRTKRSVATVAYSNAPGVIGKHVALLLFPACMGRGSVDIRQAARWSHLRPLRG